MSGVSSTIVRDLPELPREPLTPTQQLEALRRVQAQAEQRIRLGQKLFKAAEAHATQQQSIIEQVKTEQQRLRAEVQQDVAKSLQAYDQWVGRIDENFTRALQSLEDRVTALEKQAAESREESQAMLRRAEALLDQSRTMLEDVRRPRPAPVTLSTPPDPPAPPKPLQSPLAIKVKPPTEHHDAAPLSVSASHSADDEAPPDTTAPQDEADPAISYRAILQKIRELPSADQPAAE